MNRVSILRCHSYEDEEVFAAVCTIAEHTAFPDVRGKSVLLKPNILTDSKVENGITTHPSLVKAVVRLCHDRGAKRVYVGDSPGLHTPSFCGEGCGIAQACQEAGAEWVDFSSEPKRIRLSNGDSVSVASILDRVDLVISLSKFKTHQLMYSTGPVKNMFGLMPGLNKSPMHLAHPSREGFASFINSLFAVSKCAYAFVDGIIGMEGSGPANGTLRSVGLLFGGADAYLVDSVQARIMGYRSQDMPILRNHRFTEDPLFTDLSPDEVALSDFRLVEVEKPKGLFASLILPFFTRGHERKKTRKRCAPDFDSNTCIHCLRCVKICPAKALTHSDRIMIDTDKCIRCYCCAEVCPADAVRVEKS